MSKTFCTFEAFDNNACGCERCSRWRQRQIVIAASNLPVVTCDDIHLDLAPRKSARKGR